MIQSTEKRRSTISDSDDETTDDYNPFFVRINGAPRCGISLHVTPTNKRRNNRDWTDSQYFFKGSLRSVRRRQLTYVWIVRKQRWSKMKCCSTTLQKTGLVLHSMCRSHMNFSDKYIMIKPFFEFFMPSMQHYC